MNKAWIGLIIAGCASPAGTTGPSADLPLIEPPVHAAAPSGFAGGRSAHHLALDATLSASDFRDRFFNPAGGPTDVYRILSDVDARLTEVNAAGDAPCLADAPVAYSHAPFGQSVTFAAQCYRMLGTSSPAAFMQFGRMDDATYLYVTGGAARVAARVTGTTDAPIVDVWYGVGYTNGSCGGGSFDGCSYGVTQIHAEPATQAFEMSVAGVGVGYCGAQVHADGASIYGVGSTDMGATCNAPATLCVDGTDLASPGACDALSTFSIPALGRAAGAGAHVFGASLYPATPNITLDGTPTDSLGFGPADAPTTGVADFTAP